MCPKLSHFRKPSNNRQIERKGKFCWAMASVGLARTTSSSYEALYKQADFENLSPGAREAFSALGTTDFEMVIKALRQTALLARVYVPDRPELMTSLIQDAKGLRDVLVNTIARNHPARPQEIAPHRYQACRTFLDSFECIYTLNYDLLLYWALMQDELPPTGQVAPSTVDSGSILPLVDFGFTVTGKMAITDDHGPAISGLQAHIRSTSPIISMS